VEPGRPRLPRRVRAKALVDGDITGEAGDTFEAGALGEYTVEEGGSVLLGEPFVFDARTSRLRLLVPAGRPAAPPPAGRRAERRRWSASASRSRSGPSASTSTGPARRRVARRCCEALADTGWHNYSLFLRDDGLLVGYFETPSLDDALAGMAATDVNARWQARWPSSSRTSATHAGHRLPAAERGLPPGGPARTRRDWHPDDRVTTEVG
jgi:hypothetical protein